MNALLNTWNNTIHSALHPTTHTTSTTTTTNNHTVTTQTVPANAQTNTTNTNFKYEGEKNEKGQKHGQGVMWYSNTAYYSGEWKDDQMDGKGEYCWGDGHKYVGHFEKGKQHGRGVYTWPTGGQYCGNWKNDKMNGFGKYIRNDGVVYIGMWKEDHQFGMGIKLIPERVAYGPKQEMFRKRKYREVWSGDQKLVYHKEIQEYPDLYKVYQHKGNAFSDIDIITQSDDNMDFE